MLPRSLKIGAHKFTVRRGSVREMGRNTLADMTPSKNRIRVTRNSSGSRDVELTLHEVIHAMLCGHGFRDEESVAVILGEGLTSFVHDNPEFILKALKVLVGKKNFEKVLDSVASAK